MQHLLDDFREINRKLEDASEKEQKSHFYMDMIVLIEEIADYIIPKDNEILGKDWVRLWVVRF